MNENAAVQNEHVTLQQQFENGLIEGYHANPNQLPEWWYTTVPHRLDAKQRGWWMGRELRVREGAY